MNITKENVDALNAILKMKIEKADYEPKLNETLKDFRKKADVKGFRKGMVPMGLVKKMYGKSAMADEVNKLVSDNLYKYLIDEKLNILGDPLPSAKQNMIDWDTAEEFEFVFDLGMAPEFEFSLTDKDVFPYYTIKVGEEMINQRIESITQQNGEYKDAEEVDEDSMVKGTFKQVAENGIYIEEASFLTKTIKDEEIQALLKGKKKDETVTLDIKKAFTNDVDLSSMLKIEKEEAEALEGDFEFTFTDISKYQAGELSQEMYDKIYGEGVVNSEEELKAKITEEIASDLQHESEYKFALDLKAELIKKFDLSFPVDFLKRWLETTNKELSREQIDKEWPKFEEDLTWQLIKDKVVQEKEIKVEKEDMMEMARKVTLSQFRQYGLSSLPDEQLDQFANQLLENEEQSKKIAESKRDEMIHEAMKGMVKLDTKEVESEEFAKMLTPEAAIPTEELKVEETKED